MAHQNTARDYCSEHGCEAGMYWKKLVVEISVQLEEFEINRLEENKARLSLICWMGRKWIPTLDLHRPILDVKKILRWNPYGNWVILIFSGQKHRTRIISGILHSFSHFSRAINVISSMKQTSKASNLTKWNLLHDDFTCEVWNLFSRASVRNCLWCYYT